jgi:hypothetical protein
MTVTTAAPAAIDTTWLMPQSASYAVVARPTRCGGVDRCSSVTRAMNGTVMPMPIAAAAASTAGDAGTAMPAVASP